MSTKVRLKADAHQHTAQHKRRTYKYENGRYLARSSTPLIVIGAPVYPQASWACDTDVVWPVLWIEGIGDIKPMEDGGRPYVCRHQIEAGD